MEITANTIDSMNATLDTTSDATIINGDAPVTIPLAPATTEALEFLGELINDAVVRNSALSRDASSAVVTLLENHVRLGFYCDDAFRYLAGEGQYQHWIESHCTGLDLRLARRLRALSRHFGRDLIDSQQRERLGIKPPGLASAICAEHLRNQIIKTQAGSLRQLFHLTGLLPPSQQPQLTNGNGKERPASSPLSRHLANAERLLESLRKELNRLDPCRLEEGQRHELASGMRKLLAYYQAIKDS